MAEEAARDYEPSGRDIMNVLGQIAKNMVVKDDLRAEITEALVPVYAHLQVVAAKSERALQQSMNLNERLVAIESKSLADSDRVGRLEAVVGSGDGLRVSDEFRRLFKANEAMDPAHSRIEFKGFSEKDSAHDRVCKIETAVIKILNGITYHVSHIPTGPRGKRTLGNSYLQFVSEFDREAAFAKLTGKVSFKNSKGEIVKFERARTNICFGSRFVLFRKNIDRGPRLSSGNSVAPLCAAAPFAHLDSLDSLRLLCQYGSSCRIWSSDNSIERSSSSASGFK